MTLFQSVFELKVAVKMIFDGALVLVGNKMISSMPEATALDNICCGETVTRGNISLGWALVAGKNRVQKPATGMTALVTNCIAILYNFH